MKDKKQFWQAVKFTLFSISAGAIQIGSFALLANFVLEFLFCKLVVYRGQEDTLNK